jgi:putative transposase
MSIQRQCELAGLVRSSWYYKGRGESEENLRLMRLIDEQYTRTPFYGERRITAWLRDQEEMVNHKRVGRLMREMGLEAVYPKPKLSLKNQAHKVYPYLLKGVTIDRPNQVWCSDITYIRLAEGFIYLVAIMDWFSRYVLSWEISVTMDTEFCISALENALRKGRPDIFNSDQGSQFTCSDFTKVLKESNVRISMDGRGRVFDNIFIERLWRSVKYEEVYMKDYENVPMAFDNLGGYFTFYNQERFHQSLQYRTPEAVYRGLVAA